MSASNAEPLSHTMIREGSNNLIHALRREHPRIVHTLTKKNPLREKANDI